MQRIVFLLWVWVVAFVGSRSAAATYYVSVSGSDLNTGTTNQPWLTFAKAASSVAPGDTVFVLPGIYYNGSNYCRVGTPWTTWLATGPVTNRFGLYVSGPSNTFGGFTFEGYTTNNPAPWAIASGILLLPTANYTVMTNLTFQHMVGSPYNGFGGVQGIYWYNVGPLNTQAATNCTIRDCVFNDFFDGLGISTFGMNHLIEHCWFGNFQVSQPVRSEGSNIVIRLCTFTNIVNWFPSTPLSGQLAGYHPDIMQVFGSQGTTAQAILFERNYVIGNPSDEIQILQSSMGYCASTPNYSFVTNWANWGITFQNNLFCFTAQASIDIPNVRWFNNTFYRCNQGNQALLQYAYEDPTATPFYQCGGNGGVSYGGVVMNNAFIECNIGNSYGYSAIPVTWGTNINYPGGGPVSWTNPTPAVDLKADYNFTCDADGAPKVNSGFIEPHGINGGIINFSSTNGWPASTLQAMLGSSLIDHGTNLAVYGVTNDFFGSARPLGLTNDIGAMEFDPSLRLRLDFDEDFFAGSVLDTTGYGANGYRFNPTNWITTTNGVFGTTAGQWTINGIMTNGPPAVYPLSQYLGITNVAGFQFLTNATISYWVQYDGGASNQAIYILDSAYDAVYAQSPQQASNSWSILHRGVFNDTLFTVCPSGGGFATVLSWPSDTGSATTNFSLYTLTVDCVSKVATAYKDGQALQTNSIDLPYLKVYGTVNQPWLCVGAMAHDGTPQWGDDPYPNSGYMSGKLDDIRIYNRTLSSAEVHNLYTGTGAALQPFSPGGTGGATNPPAPPIGLHIVIAGQ